MRSISTKQTGSADGWRSGRDVVGVILSLWLMVARPRIGHRADWTETSRAFELTAARQVRGKAVLTLG